MKVETQRVLFYVFSPLALGAQQPEGISLFNFFYIERTLCSASVFVLAFWVDRTIQAHTRIVFDYVLLARSSSSSSSQFTAKADSSFVVFASWLDSLQGEVTPLSGHFLGH